MTEHHTFRNISSSSPSCRSSSPPNTSRDSTSSSSSRARHPSSRNTTSSGSSARGWSMCSTSGTASSRRPRRRHATIPARRLGRGGRVVDERCVGREESRVNVGWGALCGHVAVGVVVFGFRRREVFGAGEGLRRGCLEGGVSIVAHASRCLNPVDMHTSGKSTQNALIFSP